MTGKPRAWLRVDGEVLLVASVILFALTHQHGWTYPALFLVPDVFTIGYIRSTKVGALCYNAGHGYFLPSPLVLYGWHHPLALATGLIWLGHVGFDRIAGYGIKYDTDFKHTHLGSLFKEKHDAGSDQQSLFATPVRSSASLQHSECKVRVVAQTRDHGATVGQDQERIGVSLDLQTRRQGNRVRRRGSNSSLPDHY